MNTLSTKDSILHVAHSLFSERGLDGVGIREIAKVANVNVSAINYHFQNKENLYLETVRKSIHETKVMVHKLCENHKGESVENILMALFDYFSENQEDLKTTYKLFLDFDHGLVESQVKLFDAEDEVIGPPGGAALLNCLAESHPGASRENLIWAVRVLFSQILQKSIILCNECNSDRFKQGLITKHEFTYSLRRLIKVIIAEVETPQFPFQSLSQM